MAKKKLFSHWKQSDILPWWCLVWFLFFLTRFIIGYNWVVLRRSSWTTNCFMNYHPFFLFCPSKLTFTQWPINEQSVKERASFSNNYNAYNSPVYTCYFLVLSDFWSTCVQKVTNTKAQKKTVIVIWKNKGMNSQWI